MPASLAMHLFLSRSTSKCFKPMPSPNSPEKLRPSLSKGKKKGYFSFRKQDEVDKIKLLPSTDSQASFKPNSTLFNVISEVVDGEPAAGIVSTIFQSGWSNHKEVPKIEKILRVNHIVEVLKRFEEYRELVKSRAAESCVGNSKERLMADGNEVLRHHGATLICPLGFGGNSSICGQKSCEVCGTLGSNDSGKAVEISFSETSSGAHEKMMIDYVNEGYSRKAMLICRVIAGRIAYDNPNTFALMEDSGFDSLLVSSKDDQSNCSEELIVLDPRAVLPCFVVIYAFK